VLRVRGIRLALVSGAWVASLAAAGCGGPRAEMRNENGHLTKTVQELRAEARRDRNHIRDLEHEVVLLRQSGAAEPRPKLPVEVVAPDGGEPDVLSGSPDEGGPTAVPDSRPDAAAGNNEPYRVVGVDEDGNEIVYAGDAARDRVARPSIRVYQGEAARDLAPEPALDGEAEPAPPPRPVRPVSRWTGPQRRDSLGAHGDALGVTDRVPPIDGRVAAVVRPGAARPTARSGPTGPAAPAPAGRPAAAATEAEAGTPVAQYQRYVAALKAGNHAYAIAGFKNFLELYPDHDYADNAGYWLGEAFYDKKDFASALAQFRRVASDYPDGNKVPDALLKAGFCYLALGDERNARALLHQVATSYPKSTPALLATRRLAELDAAASAPGKPR
jgi:tol-pal system protein YbgF